MALSLFIFFFFGAIRYSLFDSFFGSLCHYVVLADNFFFFLGQKNRCLIEKLLRINNVIYLLCPDRLSVSYRMNVRTSQKMLGVHR